MGKRGEEFVYEVLGLPRPEEKALLDAQARIAALEKERDSLADAHVLAIQQRDAAIADNAEVLAAIKSMCQTIREQGGFVGPMMDLFLAQPHPGASLLEEHRKALVRARNEGLEKAATRADACATESAGWTARAPRRVASWVADEIRAMKESESEG